MERTHLYLLGSPRIERDGQPVAVDTRKAFAMLAYLVLTEGPQSRDSLAALLWPDSDAVHAKAALRRTLSALNKATAGRVLNTDRRAVSFVPGDEVWVDVAEFSSLIERRDDHGHELTEVCPRCVPILEKAVSLYGGDLLSGLALRDSPTFDEWQLFQTEGLRRQLAQALEGLAWGHASDARFDAAIVYATRWLALDTLHEPAHRLTMQLYVWSGQRNAALRQYRECVRVLENELGVLPLEETTQLYETIKENQLASPSRPADSRKGRVGAAKRPASATQRSSTYPLVGRSAEMTAMAEASEAIGEDGRLLVLEGEAGIGKTRLAEAFIERMSAVGNAALTARCYEGESSLAYGPIIEWLKEAEAMAPEKGVPPPATRSLSEAARLLPELRGRRSDLPEAPRLDSPGAQRNFYEGVCDVLTAACGTSGVLFLDDVHWADEATLEMLHYLARRLVGRPVCLLVTWRSEEVPSSHRLRRMFAEASRSSLATHLPLGRLQPDEVAAVVESFRASGVDVPGQLEVGLYEETEGLPFFVVEYLAARRDVAAGSDAEGPTVPDSVRDLLLSRIIQVSDAGRQLLSTAAVIGRSFGFETLREASGRSEDEAVSALEELVSRSIVREVAHPDDSAGLEYDFSHEKLRSLAYEETSLARRRLLHRRVGEAIAKRGRPGQHSSQIAHHYQLAGRESEAAHHFRLAADHARSLFANTDAIGHYESSLALGHPEAPLIYEALGDLKTLAGEYGAAIASYETAAATGDADALPRLEHKLGGVHHRRGEWELAESHFEAATEALDGGSPPGIRPRILADWSLTAHHAGDSERARELARQALEAAEAADDTEALAQAHNIAGILEKSEGELERAVSHLERSLELARELDEMSGALVAALNNLALTCAALGQTDRARELVQTALERCTSQGDRHREAALHNHMADLLHSVGKREESITHLKQAVKIFAEIGSDGAATPQPEIWKLVEW